ncbi:MAG: aminotransferase class V-fold PLP-dependent enzyme [Rhodobacteraceae bacterium]|nr:aminotransferase class V-fold PLP-dependent enzyme [Paracoccaceae bacterium]
MLEDEFEWHRKQGVKPIINVSGTMTGLGASIAAPGVAKATAEAMANFVSIHQAQEKASEVIARLTGAEAGFLTASASAGITLSIAACITGLDPARVEELPINIGEKNEVIVQSGHLCGYGAPVAQAVALSGARVRSVGQSTLCMDHQITGAIGRTTAAALFVVSHHVVHYGQCPLKRFVTLCHKAEIPIIVDAASEHDLRGFLKAEADLVVYSGHKFLGGPTSGIVAGRRDLVRAAYLQNIGIGRGMKIGKESIFGTIAALEAWETRDHAAIRTKEAKALGSWTHALSNIPGVTTTRVADPTGNPIDRLQVDINSEEVGISAATVARLLGERDPAIIVRTHGLDLGYFQLDPCNLLPGQAERVATALREVLSSAETSAAKPGDTEIARNGSTRAYLDWGKS